MLAEDFVEYSVVRLADGREGTVACVLGAGKAAIIEIEGNDELITVWQEDVDEVIWEP